MDRILLWSVQSQGQWSISAGLSPDRHRGRPAHPSRRSVGCSTIVGERKVSWSWQHPSRTGPSRWRGSNYRFHDNLRQDLADKRMADTVDTVVGYHPPQERQPAAVLELPNDQPHEPPKRSHAEDHTGQIEAARGLQSRKEHHRADLQPTNPLWEIYIHHKRDLYHVFIYF